MKKNESGLDRLIRVLLGEVLLIVGFFWSWGYWQIVAFVFSLIMFVTALNGFCLIYKIFGINTDNGRPVSRSMKIVFGVLFLIIAIAGTYSSDFFTKKFFLDDYNRMNNFYKQTLFNTGQGKRAESIDNYDKLVSEFTVFSSKYSSYHPYVIMNDEQFNGDLINISNIISGLKEKVYTGDLELVHLDFEVIRPIFQEILKRNGFSMLQVYLVDFHDAMEKIIEVADAKDSKGVIAVYPEVSDKLKAVEDIANDDEIKAIRENLDEVLRLATDGKVNELSAKAAQLKSSFVKVYLVRG
ncbi:MAG: hypothetical protein UT05_C0002G0021 [Parcubacteria group bacterium GW2011_GWF2_38_76]|nr:MAG: hypothetical protein UT05_C0002G0021 [Parcubacteria group bacterium GW2011_GWF2_38_76]HBM45821.1 hypothetical protein [Patescibacteria group bacterium]